MQKKPFILYIVRFFLGITLIGFLGLLYWSSLLIEKDVNKLEIEIEKIQNEMEILNQYSQKINQNGNSNNHSDPSPEMPFADASIPNLLSEDPFFKVTLPQMLGKNFKPHGIRREATVGRPDNLHPFSNWSQVAGWQSQCSVSLGGNHFGKFETFGPEMAIKMELRLNNEGQPEYWLHLRKDVFWLPLNPLHFEPAIPLSPHFFKKHPVTAHDFKFYYDAIMNPFTEEDLAVALREYYKDILEMKVIDDFTLVVRWRTENIMDETGKPISRMKYLAKSWTTSLRPLASFVYQYFSDGSKIISNDSDPNTYRNNSIWAQNFNQHWAKNIIVSCGPWMFDGMTDRQIRFKRNPNYFSPYVVLAEALEIDFKNSDDGIWDDFKAGSLDLFYLPPNQLSDLDRFLSSPLYEEQKEKDPERYSINRLNYISRSYEYIGWNQKKVFFKSKKVRQALTMAIDRERIIQDYLNGLGIEITGTFFVYSPSYDSSLVPYPFDLTQAKRLLEEEGWFDTDGDGIIDKEINGQQVPFEFTLTYYVKSPTTQAICEFIATSLKKIGIACKTNGVDIADLSALFDDKNFDAFVLGWGLGSPPEDPKQLWYSKGADEKGSSNVIGFANEEIDEIIEKLQYEYDPDRRIELYHNFDKIIYDEAPYTFLYTPKQALIYRNYLQNVFIPAERQDLIPGANVGEPSSNLFWISQNKNGDKGD